VSASRRGFIGSLISGAGALIVGRKIDAAPAETNEIPSNILAKTAQAKQTGFLASGQHCSPVTEFTFDKICGCGRHTVYTVHMRNGSAYCNHCGGYCFPVGF